MTSNQAFFLRSQHSLEFDRLLLLNVNEFGSAIFDTLPTFSHIAIDYYCLTLMDW